MTADSGLLAVTGANGELGRRLLRRAGEVAPPRALVRSRSAANTVATTPLAAESRPGVRIVDYADEASMATALDGAGTIVHLVGILRESSRSRYPDAHEASCRVLARVSRAAGIRRIVYLSILGSHPDSKNACLASKGRAERILLEAEVAATVLRVPMVLGGGDPASLALGRQARARWLPLVRGGASLEQPIDAIDVVSAILAAVADEGRDSVVLDLAGPESLSHRALVDRAAGICGRRPPFVLPVPRFAVRGVAWLAERFAQDPPLTRTMLDVLERDDRVDNADALARLGIALTPLDETLRRCVAEEVPES